MTTTETKIREAYKTIAPRQEWIGIAEIRQALPQIDRNEMNTALKALAIARTAHIIPVANLKALTQADQDAALWMGGEWNHAIQIHG